MECLTGESWLKTGRRRTAKPERKDEGKETYQYGFGEELSDKVFLVEPATLRMPTSFARLAEWAVLRFIKDAGDQQDEDGDHGEDIYIKVIAVGFEFTGKIECRWMSVTSMAG